MPSRKSAITISIGVATSLLIFALFVTNSGETSDNENVENSDVTEFQADTVAESSSVELFKSPYITEYSLPSGTWPNGILSDGNGTVWIGGSESNTIISFDPKEAKIKSSHYIAEKDSAMRESRTSHLMIWSIVQDKDGLIWFSQMGPDPLWQFNPKTAKFTAFHTSTAPFQIKVDQKTGKVWFTTLAGSIGAIQKLADFSYKITEFEIGSEALPSGLFVKDGSLWVTLIQGQKAVKFSMVSDKDGFVTEIKREFEIPPNNQTRIFSPTDVIDSDDFLWITEHGTSFLTKYDIKSNHLTRYPTMPTAQNTTTLPFWLRQTADGIWFNEHTGNRIAFFDTKNNVLTEYEILSRPRDGNVVYPLNIAADSFNEEILWFSEWNTDKFGVVDKSIPPPVDIKIKEKKIIISSQNGNGAIDFEVIKNEAASIVNDTVFLGVSSSASYTSDVVNMTAAFSQNVLDLSEMGQKTPIRLELQNHGVKNGNYTLGITATDGIVTRSVFVDLIIDDTS